MCENVVLLETPPISYIKLEILFVILFFYSRCSSQGATGRFSGKVFVNDFFRLAREMFWYKLHPLPSSSIMGFQNN